MKYRENAEELISIYLHLASSKCSIISTAKKTQPSTFIKKLNS